MKTVLAVIGVLWLARHWDIGRNKQRIGTEAEAKNPYQTIDGNNAWAVANGDIWPSPIGPNAHTPHFTRNIGIEPITGHGCVTK